MKVYRTIVIVVAVLFGIFYFFVALFGPAAQIARHDPPTEEHYELLKEEALKVAKTLDRNALTDETLTADFYFNEDELVVTVESIKAKLTAKIPISNRSFSIEDNTIISKGLCKFENAKYEKADLVHPIWVYIVISIFVSPILGFSLYFILFGMWNLKKHHSKENQLWCIDLD